MTTTRAAWSSLLTEGLRKIYDTTDKTQAKEFEKIFEIMTSKKYSETDFRMAGLGMAQDKTEGATITFADPTAGATKTLTHKTIALGFRVTKEMYEDDLYGPIRNMPKRLNNSIYNKIEYDASALFADAFTGSTYTAWDSLAIISNAHTSLAGANQSNMPAAHCDLSATALKNAMISLDSLKDDNGDPMPMTPAKLIVGPSDRLTATEILKTTGVPYSADNTINVLKGEMAIINYHWLADTDAWFVLAADNGLKFWWRVKPEFKELPDTNTDDAKYYGRARYSFSCFAWRGIYGSSGA